MYYYPDNLQESILIFQNGDFDYKKIPQKLKEESNAKEYEYLRWDDYTNEILAGGNNLYYC